MEFKGGWEQYAEDYCFIQNTYYVPMEEEIPKDITDRDQREFGYYQWVCNFYGLFYTYGALWPAQHMCCDVPYIIVNWGKIDHNIDLKGLICESVDFRCLSC